MPVTHPPFNPTEWVRVLNKESTPITLGYHNRRYTIDPGTDGFVPFEAMCISFGDPRSFVNGVAYKEPGSDETIGIPPREEIIARLGALYGLEVNGAYSTDPAYILAHMPQVEIYTQKGERITQVCEDPNCEKDILPIAVDNRYSTDFRQREARLEQELAAIKAMLNRQQTQINSQPGVEPDSPEDILEDGVGGASSYMSATPTGPPTKPEPSPLRVSTTRSRVRTS